MRSAASSGKRVRAITFRAVAITNQLEQTLFETYPIIEMGTAPKYNDFENSLKLAKRRTA